MGETTVPPGGGGHEREGGGGGVKSGDGKMSYSDRLKTNVRFDQRLKRNVLEITLEKTDKHGEFDVDGEDVARVAKTLEIDILSQTQGYQLQYRGKFSVISVWMVPGINLDRFCKDINIRVTDNVMTGIIRPSGKKDVTVSIVGLDFNTPDTFVFEYLNKFGVVVNQSVIYSKVETGAWKGKYNGERKYQVDFSKATNNMGTYHLIDGNKVRVYYRGNKKSCGRCHRTATDCPGDAIAKDCGANGGGRVMLSEHMKALWTKVGFVPTTFELENDDKNEDDGQQDSVIIDSKFPSNINRPEPTNRDIEFYNGITVKNIPNTVADKEIRTFLINHGVPHDHPNDMVRINKRDKNTFVVIDGVSPEQVQIIFHSIHFPETKQKFFDFPLYCKPLRNMTPEKPPQLANNDVADITEQTESTDDNEKNDVDDSLNAQIPGLTKSQQKKALRKIREKKLKDDKKKKEEAKEAFKKSPRTKNGNKSTKEPKTKFDFLKKDLVKCGLYEDEIEDQFSFGESEDDLPTFKEGKSKFFRKPKSNDKDLEGLLSQSQNKRLLVLSPESELDPRNNRPRH